MKLLAISVNDMNISKSSSLYTVSVYLKGDTLNPELISEKLGIAPTKSHWKGFSFTTSTQHEVVKSTGLWCLSIDGSTEVSATISTLASNLLRSGCDLSSLPGVEESYVDIFYAERADDLAGAECSFTCDARCLALLAALQLPVHFTVATVEP